MEHHSRVLRAVVLALFAMLFAASAAPSGHSGSTPGDRSWSGGTGPVDLTPPGLVAGATAAIADSALEGYRRSLGEALRAEFESTSSRAFLRFMKSPAGRLASLQWMLLSRIGPEGLEEISSGGPDEQGRSSEREASLTWVLTDPEVLGAFLGAGDLDAGTWAESLDVFCRLLEADEEESILKGGLPRRLAIATALTWSKPVTWMADGSEIDPVDRWRSFLEWDEQGLLYATFRDLCAWELRYVVGSWSNDEDLVWARANIKDELRQRDRVGDGAHMLAYNLVNKDGVSVQAGRRFYDDKPMTMAIMLEYGGVCGAISRFGSSMSQAFGVPAMPVGQPGHCAFIWQKSPHRWSINNDISGWAQSGRHAGIQIVWSDLAGARAWLVPLMQEAQADAEGFLDGERHLAMAGAFEGADSDAIRLALLEEACRRSPRHLAAWCARAEAVADAADGRRGRRAVEVVARDAARALDGHPTAYMAVVARLADMLVPAEASSREREAFVREQARRLAGMGVDGADAGLVAWACRDLLTRSAEGMVPEARAAARAIPQGSAPRGHAISEADAAEVFDLAFAASLELDVAPNGPSHAAWRTATGRLIDGVVQQPVVREHGLPELQRLVRSLSRSRRLEDARWIADRLVKATAAHGDEDLQQRAKLLRSQLGE